MPALASFALDSLASRLTAPFRKPFHGLVWLIWIYVVFCYLAHPDSQILAGHLPDSDDYMVLAQVSDWLKVQGWFDLTQHRLNPPEGVPMAFERLTQLPVAVLTLLFQPLLGFKEALWAAPIVWPLALLALFLHVLVRGAKGYVEKGAERLTAFVALFATYLLYQFAPGHIDHHGMTALFVAFAYGLGARMTAAPQDKRYAIGAGIILALGLGTALEILPYLLLFAAWLGLWSVAKGRQAALQGALFALTLYFVSALILALTRPFAEWFTPDALRFSIVYVSLTGGIALSFVGPLLVRNKAPIWRWLLGGGLAFLSGALFFWCYPALLGGPYGAMNDELARLMFASITEARPILKPDVAMLELFLRLLWPA
ncbi:MAG: hypothetical protein HGA90_01305, partial [Alphaproteobacteria bacterium]|nr:hypothetical protein [Alphaproteobacteria bacterium]